MSLLQTTTFLRFSLQHLLKFFFDIFTQPQPCWSSRHHPLLFPPHHTGALSLVSQGVLGVQQCMLEKLPLVQVQHSLPWEPLTLQPCSHAPMALCLSHCAMTISFCFKNNKRRFSEHCQPAQVQVLGDGGPETTITQPWLQLQKQIELQQFSRRDQNIFSREVTQKGV